MTQMDLVTEAQQQLSVLCSHFCATIGSLQRDAPPLSVKGEPILGPAMAPQTPISQQTNTMAQQVIQSSQQLEKLIMQLPDRIESEQQQFETLQELQQQHVQSGAALDTALQQAQGALSQVQDCFANIADSHLQSIGEQEFIQKQQ